MESWKKTFAVIWSGQLASILSSEVVAYSIIFWMSLETGSAEVLALAAIAGMLPQSLLGPLVGVYVDRWDRKRTMILADLQDRREQAFDGAVFCDLPESR